MCYRSLHICPTQVLASVVLLLFRFDISELSAPPTIIQLINRNSCDVSSSSVTFNVTWLSDLSVCFFAWRSSDRWQGRRYWFTLWVFIWFVDSLCESSHGLWSVTGSLTLVHYMSDPLVCGRWQGLRYWFTLWVFRWLVVGDRVTDIGSLCECSFCVWLVTGSPILVHYVSVKLQSLTNAHRSNTPYGCPCKRNRHASHLANISPTGTRRGWTHRTAC